VNRFWVVFHVWSWGSFVFGGETTIRVASVNVESYLVCDRWVERKFQKSYPKPEGPKEALRRLVRQVRPDILALQEMGPREFLMEFKKDLEAEGIEFPYDLILEASDPQRHVALLSRIPFEEVCLHSDISFLYQTQRAYAKRGMLEVHFKTEGQRWGLFVIHLKSKRDMPEDPYSCLFRSGEAKAVVDRIRQRLPTPFTPFEPFILAGDFNDSRSSRTFKRFLRLPIKYFAHLDSRGESWTYRYDRDGAYIQHDFLLVSEALAPFLRVPQIFLVDGPDSLVASDHRMMYLDLIFGSLEKSTDMTEEGSSRVGFFFGKILRKVRNFFSRP
jgi:endonuclease/exonuclease/phosphatase family metal-dependent hydrolase